MSDSPNPYAVTTLELADPVRPAQPTSRVTLAIVYIAQALMFVGLVFAWIDIEAIVPSAPIMLAAGLFVTILSWRNNTFRWFGIACLVFPIIVFLTIFLLELSPSDAQVPIGILCTVFTLAMLARLALLRSSLRNLGDPVDAAGFGPITAESPASEAVSQS